MSYYENRIKHLEGLVATMAREQRMKAIPVEAKLVERIAEYQAENVRLKAEVERLESMADENAHLHKGIYSLSLNVGQLKDEVERLRKAGDGVVERLRILGANSDYSMYFINAWNAAKEGKQP